MVEKLFKRKPALLLTLGSAAGFLIGGVVAWSLLQRRPTLVGMPSGAAIIPQEAVMTVSVSTDRGQWQQLRRFGTPASQAAFDKQLAQLRDRLLIANGMNYQRDIQPWVGSEITTAFLLPAIEANGQDKAIQPYNPDALTAAEQAIVMVLPIADAGKAQQLLASPKVAATQDWVDRDYKGVKIREVHGQTEEAYAAAVVDNQFVVVANDSKAVERVIDTAKGKPSVAQTPGYGQALNHITAANPFMQLYVNIPVATALTANNASQPIPPQVLAPLKSNQGLAATVSLESEGMRIQSVSWLAANQKARFKVTNNAERMPLLLPSDALLVASGGNLKQLWQNYTQQPNNVPRLGFFDPETLRRGVNNLTGLDLDQDLIAWMNGEYALAVISSPAGNAANADKTTATKAGIVLLAQTSDRKAAEQTFKKLDELMKTRYRFQVSETQVEGKPAISWVSPFTALKVTHGWLDGNVAYLAIGSDLATTIVPTPDQPLVEHPLFRQTSSTELNPNNGQFFLEVDRLANANTNLPLPTLPSEQQVFLDAIRAIGITAALQDGRTTRYDAHVLLRKGNAPGALPPPAPINQPLPGSSETPTSPAQ